MARTTMAILLLTAASALTAACGGSDIRRFPLAEPVWVDDDTTPFESRPEEYYSGFVWDFVDQTLFVPTSRYLAVDVPGPAVNVNALDEVPNSSWFTNRIGLYDLTPEELATGACPQERLDTAGPWRVVAAKPNGANPGFIIRDAEGRGWLLKFDGHDQPERATTADVFGSRVYHAAGYWAPCNVVVAFDPDILALAEDASAEDAAGRDVPMERSHVDAVLDAAVVLSDGRLRASASLFLPGEPLGPFTYQGTRRDDPNDRIRHQDRRELRGARVLAAWLNHFDAREQNSLDVWIESEDGGGFVRHYYLDFGDCLGSRWEQDDLSRRFGTSNYFDVSHVAADFLTLGAIVRPWQTVEVSEIAPALGYFDAEHFDPERYHTGYPNPAFASMRDEDGAWMARIIARMGEDEVRAMLAEAQMSDPVVEAELLRTLMARRQRVLDHYLRVRSPLANFEVQPDGTTLCFEDLATMEGVTRTSSVRYVTESWSGSWREPSWTQSEDPDATRDPGRICISLVGDDGQRPSADTRRGPDGARAQYQITDIHIIPEPGMDPLPPARLHLRDLGDEFRLVGVERPDGHTRPGSRR